jgi:hypothetical protein
VARGEGVMKAVVMKAAKAITAWVAFMGWMAITYEIGSWAFSKSMFVFMMVVIGWVSLCIHMAVSVWEAFE